MFIQFDLIKIIHQSPYMKKNSNPREIIKEGFLESSTTSSSIFKILLRR